MSKEIIKRRMHWLADIINDRGYTIGCEVGSGVGSTTKHILANCPDLMTLYIADDWRPITDRRSKETPHVNKSWYTEPLRPRFDKAIQGYRWRCVILDGVSWEMAMYVEPYSLDFVFVDASHDFDSVLRDVNAWESRVKRGGLLCGHDIHMKGVKGALEYLEVNYKKAGVDNVWYI